MDFPNNRGCATQTQCIFVVPIKSFGRYLSPVEYLSNQRLLIYKLIIHIYIYLDIETVSPKTIVDI